jgi:hypothetical protein
MRSSVSGIDVIFFLDGDARELFPWRGPGNARIRREMKIAASWNHQPWNIDVSAVGRTAPNKEPRP